MKLLPKRGFKITIKDTYLETLLPRFKEERIGAFFTLALTLLAICIFGFFAINPTLTTITQLRKQLDDNTFVYKKLEEKIANLVALQETHERIKGDIPLVLSAIPALPDIPLFTAQVQGVAKATRVQISLLQTLPVEFTPDSSTKSYMSFGFSLTARGTTTNINNFITLLQSIDRLITLDEISLVQSADNPDVFQLSIKGKAYFKKV